MTVNEIYELALKIIRKNSAGGLPSTQFSLFWNAEQKTYMEDLLGRWQNRSNGKSGNNTGLIQNETIIQKLSPFIKNTTITISSGDGGKPADFVYALDIRMTECITTTKSTHDKKTDIERSVIDPPAIGGSGYALEYGGFYTFLPSSATTADLDYVSEVQDVLWNFSVDGDGREVYNPSGSVDPLWGDNDCVEITKRMLKTLGVSFKDRDFAQFGESIIKEGS